MNGTFNSTLTNLTNDWIPTTEEGSETSQKAAGSSAMNSLRTASYCVLILLSLAGNSFVIATVVRNTNKRMRTVSNIFIVNLSIADILVTLINMPGKISQIYIGRMWLLGKSTGFEILCKMMNFLPFLAVFVSTQSFAVLALDRFVAVYLPVRKPITAKVAYILVAFNWIFAMAFFYVYFHSASIWTHGDTSYCYVNANVVFGSMENFNKFVWVEFTVVTILPLTISFVLYTATMIKLWKRKIPGSNATANASYSDRVNRRVLKMLITVFLAFFFCWLPTWIWIIACKRTGKSSNLPALCSAKSQFSMTRFLIAYSNSAITPYIYLIFSENYRQGFKDILIAMACCSSVRKVLRRRNRVEVFTLSQFTQGDRLRTNTVSRRMERLDFTTVI
ncbi:substance-P receptor-like [Actinia tenebrosa]|uniref:Substance-P receptor-like n=1 Tax=Actinia tenebrosa TaxID=6105 RepID=A0A6P8HT04_ACTTE|nr:substance-P receptor-like [Actinia tenebrosa]